MDATRRPASAARAWQIVLERIEADLLDGRLAPGDRLPPERELAARLGVGRSSVREALRVLEVLGLIRTGTGSGPTSGAIIIATPRGGMSALLRLQVAAQRLPARRRRAHPPRARDPPSSRRVAADPARSTDAAHAVLDAMDAADLTPGRVPRARRAAPPRARRGVRQRRHRRDDGGPAHRDRVLRARRCRAHRRLGRHGRAPARASTARILDAVDAGDAASRPHPDPRPHHRLLRRSGPRPPAPDERHRPWSSASSPTPPSCSSSCSSRSPSSTAASAASTPRSRSPTCARSPSAARRRRRSTTPTAPPRASCRSRARGRRSRTSSSTPAILRPRRDVDTSATILGGPSALPFGIAPTGFTRLMQTEGEIAGASAAGAAGIPFTLSTLGTTSIEDVKAANPHGRNWFQLYVMRDREISYGLARRAAAAGFDTLQFTVDTPVAGARLRDKRNGFSIPPQLTLGTIVNAIPRPWWWYDFLTTPEARVRVAVDDRRHRRRAAQRRDGPDDQLRRPRRHPRHLAGQDRRQGRAERRGLGAPRSTPASTASSSPTTAAASSTARRSRSTCCRRSCARSARTRR